MEDPITFAEALADGISAIRNGLIVVWSSIVTNNSILPYFIIGIAISVVLVAIKIIKSVVWGS